MMQDKNTDICENCANSFEYKVIHNGFNESAHGYCDKCGMTCILNDFPSKIPQGCNLFKRHHPYRIIDEDAEKFLKPCTCGGFFRPDTLPRCPVCNLPLIQFKDNISRTIIIDNKRIEDNWK